MKLVEMRLGEVRFVIRTVLYNPNVIGLL